MSKDITIKNGETEITVNGQAISVSTPDVLARIMTDGKSASASAFTKDKIICQVQ